MIPKLKPTPNAAEGVEMTASQLLRLRVSYLLGEWAAKYGFAWVIDDGNDWPTPEEFVMPDGMTAALLVNANSDAKSSWGPQIPSFTTTVVVKVQGRLQGNTHRQAQDLMDALRYQVEKAIFTDQPLIAAIIQFAHVQTQMDINAEGEYHMGAFSTDISMEVPEIFAEGVDEDDIDEINKCRCDHAVASC